MAEYSRLASGQVISTGGPTPVICPFVPNYIEISNATRLSGTNSGVSKAWWETDMGQGAAFLTTTTNATSDLSAFIDATGGANSTSGFTMGTGFQTIQAGISLQYGPTTLLGGSGGIAKTSPTVLTVTTTAAHGLVAGNWVVFQNLYETSSTGMQQIAGIPFEVLTSGSTTTFTIGWVGNSANLTAITAGGLNGKASFKQILYPVLYAPGVAFPWSISTSGNVTTIITTAPHNFQVGQEIAFRIPAVYGSIELNSLPDVLIPGSPKYYYVASVVSDVEFTVNNLPAYTAFTVANTAFTSFPGEQFAQVLAVGDVNSGGYPYTGGALYPSPTVYNGFSRTAVSTINGPAIQGAYINATFQGFIIGSAIAGSAEDVIFWRAYLHDVNF